MQYPISYDVVVNGGVKFILAGVDRTSDVLHGLDESHSVASDCESKDTRVKCPIACPWFPCAMTLVSPPCLSAVAMAKADGKPGPHI